MLQVSRQEEDYGLEDTAIRSTDADEGIIYASRPWSVLVPFEEHPISIISSTERIDPTKAGIENLVIGEDFVLTDGSTEENSDEISEQDENRKDSQLRKRFYIVLNDDQLKKLSRDE